MLLANGHFAGVTPAIFVIFVDFRGPRSKIPCFCGQNAMSEFSPIFVKTACFRQGTKRPFSKMTVSTTPILHRNRRNRKPEPLEPFHLQTVTEPNRGLPESCNRGTTTQQRAAWDDKVVDCGLVIFFFPYSPRPPPS